jgi:hypothetical protein
MHLAGHTVRGTHRIDTHDAPVCEEVWDLYRLAVRRFGSVSTMIERDAKIPEWEVLEREVLRVHQIRREEASREPELTSTPL